jgi:hypothetical protein
MHLLDFLSSLFWSMGVSSLLELDLLVLGQPAASAATTSGLSGACGSCRVSPATGILQKAPSSLEPTAQTTCLVSQAVAPPASTSRTRKSAT